MSSRTEEMKIKIEKTLNADNGRSVEENMKSRKKKKISLIKDITVHRWFIGKFPEDYPNTSKEMFKMTCHCILISVMCWKRLKKKAMYI